ncbi:MAG TPA: hypothetical protein VFY49_11335 [Myxococcota bacterium]|nr:hypothetical protein [Myxococcota bacterium]
MRLVLASLLCVVLACAGQGGSGGGSGAPSPAKSGAPDAGSGEGGSAAGAATGFPDQKALDELLEQPLPQESALANRFRDLNEWELAGPFPESVGPAPRPGGNALDPVVGDFVAARAGLVVATASMDCYAREIGRFLVAERGMPAEALQRFAAGRCAVGTSPPRIAAFGWTGTGNLDEAGAVAKLRAEMDQRLRDSVVGGPLELGVWLHAGDGRVDVVVASGEREVRIDPVATVPGADGRVELRGELIARADWIGGAVTRGRYAWAECEADESVKLPRFHLTCAVDAADPTAWISLEYRPPERLLTNVALGVLVRPQGGDERWFRRFAYAPARDVADAAALPAALTEVLNGVRASAGLRPLTLDTAQSQVAERMAPYYFAALLGEAPQSIAELIALGMLAGWKVDGIVQDGEFAWAWVVESVDVSRLLSDALEYPGARSALLSKEAERIAVGPLVETAGAETKTAYVGIIASTYVLFSESAHRRDALHVHDRIREARAAKGLAAPGTLDDARPLTVEAATRVQAGEDPRDVLEDLIQSGAEVLKRPVVGWMAETQDLDTLVFPDDFVSREQIDVAVAVPVRRPEGEAWGRYVVLLLAAEPPARSL